jgi:pentatricopeptide repeat protein
MLPDGDDEISQENQRLTVDFIDVAYRLQEQLQLDSSTTSSKQQSSIEAWNKVTSTEANLAIQEASCRGDAKNTEHLLLLIEQNKLTISPDTLAIVTRNLSAYGEHDLAITMFNRIIETDTDPDEYGWGALIQAKAAKGDTDGAISLLNRLKSLQLTLPIDMYNEILNSYVKANKNDEAFNFWMRMHGDGAAFNINSFSIILQQCFQTQQVERAFFYYDEVKALGIPLDAHFFAQLFKCCGDAPMWVHGYEDIIFDAMDRMEGAELMPTTEVYDNIIYAFGKCGDSDAAEYYFWEMRRKGIDQTTNTYNNLFRALAR